MIPVIKYGKDDAKRVFGRTQLGNAEYVGAVAEIISAVRRDGDKALFAYAKKFDKADVSAETILVTDEEIKERYAHFTPLVKPVTGYLARYRQSVTSASEGAVFKK